jgi:hypothetical protein
VICIDGERYSVVVPWVSEKERSAFVSEWGIDCVPEWLIMQHDADGDGCGVTKNKGVEKAVLLGADIVIVLDGDCYPSEDVESLEGLIEQHSVALRPQLIERYRVVTYPPSRGTPYIDKGIIFPVAASMGFWTEIGDYCAVRQLAFCGSRMEYDKRSIYGQYFSLCGMNLAFRPREWKPWCDFIDVPRFDDIWMGWLWQKEAYRRGFCFNLGGPVIRHARQSNVWSNLRDEVRYLEDSESLWKKIAEHSSHEYDDLRSLLPV